MEWNAVGITIFAALYLLWKLDFVATLLTLKALSPEIPAEMEGVYDSERYAKSQEYTRVSAKFEIVHSIFSLTVLLVFWILGGFGWLDAWSRSVFSHPVLVGLFFFSILFLANTLLEMPFTIYDTFVIEECFGFNKTTQRLFVVDQLKFLMLAAALGLPLAAGLLWIFGNVTHAWLWAWGFFATFQLFVTWIAPSLILPLFNKFTPMPDSSLLQAIHAMAKKCGFPLSGIAVMDGSKRSTKANAYFTGFGKNKKIALFDTLVEEQSEEELVAVLAHEIGHFRLKHILQHLVTKLLQTGVLLFLLGLVIDPHGKFSRELFDAFGVKQISPHVGMVLFGLLLAPASKILDVVANISSRKHEFEADAFAAKAMDGGAPMISALKKLSARNLSNLTPHPFRVFLDHSHPPTLDRIRALRSL